MIKEELKSKLDDLVYSIRSQEEQEFKKLQQNVEKTPEKKKDEDKPSNEDFNDFWKYLNK